MPSQLRRSPRRSPTHRFVASLIAALVVWSLAFGGVRPSTAAQDDPATETATVAEVDLTVEADEDDATAEGEDAVATAETDEATAATDDVTATQDPAESELVPSTAEATGELADALPPPDLPTTNPQGYSFELDAELKADRDDVPETAPVYELRRAALDEAEVSALAERLEIEGEVDNQGDGVFVAEGNGQLFVTPDFIQYRSPDEPGTGALPADDEAIDLARAWLEENELLPSDAGEGRVVSRAETSGRLVVLVAPAEPEGLIAAFPSVSVSLGAGGAILEASSRWAEIERGDLYQLRPVDEVWEQVAAGQAYLETDLTNTNIPQGTEIEGTVEYTTVELAYTTAGGPSAQQYLEPVFVFVGELTLEGDSEPYPVKAYAAALAISDAPVGRGPSSERG